MVLEGGGTVWGYMIEALLIWKFSTYCIFRDRSVEQWPLIYVYTYMWKSQVENEH